MSTSNYMKSCRRIADNQHLVCHPGPVAFLPNSCDANRCAPCHAHGAKAKACIFSFAQSA
eukprot:2801634-Amphidinium_carterae.1